MQIYCFDKCFSCFFKTKDITSKYLLTYAAEKCTEVKTINFIAKYDAKCANVKTNTILSNAPLWAKCCKMYCCKDHCYSKRLPQREKCTAVTILCPAKCTTIRVDNIAKYNIYNWKKKQSKGNTTAKWTAIGVNTTVKCTNVRTNTIAKCTAARVNLYNYKTYRCKDEYTSKMYGCEV